MRVDARMARVPLLLGLLLPAVASANTIVLTPLIPVGVDGKGQLAVHQLIASELEFQPNVTGVQDLDARPDALTDSCLTQTPCLAGITSAHGGDRLITGTLSSSGNGYVLDLVLYDNGSKSIVRRKSFDISRDPTEMANGMTAIMSELLTGDGPPPAAGATGLAAAESFRAGGDDDFAFTPAPTPPVGARPAPPPPEYLPDLEDLDAEVATAAPRPVIPAPAPAPPPPPPPEPEIDPSMITFGGSAADITTEEIDQMIQFGSPPVADAQPAPAYAPVPQPAYTPPPQPAYTPPPPQPQPAPYAAQPSSRSGGIADLDGDAEGRSNKSPSRGNSGANATADRPGARYLQITARGGYSKYFAFDFLTAGAEVAVPLVAGLHGLVGLESYSVNRRLPVEVQVATNTISAWDTIFPINAGLMYKLTGNVVQPYGGADVIFVQYYSDEIGADWAGGGRARVGADFMLAPNFGLNLNAAIGFWSGQNWNLIDSGLQNSGVLPQISAGTVLAF